MKICWKSLQKHFSLLERLLLILLRSLYNFQTSNGKQSENDNITNCSSQQNTYIWSEAALYLLGPRALYWCTLFAVDLHEVDVTIELPCLCSEAYNSLLSRLTYLVCICYNNKLCIRT